jgi:hypothetical protein
MRAEADALVRPGSPVPSLDIRGRPRFTNMSAILGLDIDPPTAVKGDGESQLPKAERRGVIGWISKLFGRGTSPGGSGGSGRYAPLVQEND